MDCGWFILCVWDFTAVIFRLIVLVALYWFRLCGCFSFCCVLLCCFGCVCISWYVLIAVRRLLAVVFVGCCLVLIVVVLGFGGFLFVFWT